MLLLRMGQQRDQPQVRKEPYLGGGIQDSRVYPCDRYRPCPLLWERNKML